MYIFLFLLKGETPFGHNHGPSEVNFAHQIVDGLKINKKPDLSDEILTRCEILIL